MQQWEYLRLNTYLKHDELMKKYGTSDVDQILSIIGKQGWEMVNCYCDGSSFVFKRPITENLTTASYSASQEYTQKKEWTMEEIFPGIAP